MLTPRILPDLHHALETHRYFQENDDTLTQVIEAALNTLDDRKKPTAVLYDFQNEIIHLFPHPSLPYGENTDIKTLRRFARRTNEDIANEARYNVVMVAYMDVARAHLVTSRAPVNDIRNFEHSGTKLLSS